MPVAVCLVCKLPPETREAIEAAIRKKEKYRDLEARTGISKSCLHRHAHKHMAREIIEAHRAGRFHPGKHRIVYAYPDHFEALMRRESIRPHDFTVTIPRDQLTENDFLIEVSFDAPPKTVQQVENTPLESPTLQ